MRSHHPDEQEAQSAYSNEVQETNASVTDKQKAIANLSQTKAQAEIDHTTASDAEAAAVAELEKLAGQNAALHKSCDFVVKNFDLRQEARQQEMDAIEQAKAVLSGADFSF